MPHPEQEHALMIEVARLRHELKAAQASCVQEKARADAAEAQADHKKCGQGLVRLQEALAAARRECGAMRKALEPFAKMADRKDDWPANSGCAHFPSMAQVRAARAALAAPAAMSEEDDDHGPQPLTDFLGDD